MSDIDVQVRTRLVSQVTNVSGRVYPIQRPQKSLLPALTYQRVATTRESAMGEDTGMVHLRYQVTAFAEDFSAVRGVAAQVRSALQRWSGSTSAADVHEVFLVGEMDLTHDVDQSDRPVWATALDFVVHHEEA